MTTALVAALACWTNVVGHVVRATPLSVADGKAVFEVPAANGSCATNSYPLAVFPAAERSRIRAALGVEEPPKDAAEANRRAFAAREERRIAAMERDGLLAADEAAKRRESLRGFVDFKGNRKTGGNKETR